MKNEYVLPVLKGGLGNNLFQLSTAISYGLNFEKKIYVDYRDINHGHKNINSYISNIFRNIRFDTLVDSFNIYNEKNFKYSEIPHFDKNIKLVGYFQSEKYFKKHRNNLLNLFSISKDLKDKLYDLYGYYLINNPISIHIRRGDYLKLQQFHPVLPLSYYQQAIEYFGSDNYFMIFSDDINWCKENFDFLKNKIFVESLEDYEEIYLISSCNHNINANSSFSWWGSWLNTNEHKKVIFPSLWFGKNYRFHDTSDLYFEGCKKI